MIKILKYLFFIALVSYGIYFLVFGNKMTFEVPSGAQDSMNLKSAKLAVLPDEKEIKNVKVFMSPNGNFAVWTGEDISSGKKILGVNDKTIKNIEKIGTPIFNSSGALAFVPVEENFSKKIYFISGGEIRKINDAYWEDFSNSGVFSPDGKTFSYISEKLNKKFLIIGQSEYGPYENVSLPIFSSDGKHTAFVAGEKDKMFVVKDGVEENRFLFVSKPVWSGNGLKLAYNAVSKMSEDGMKNECFIVLEKFEKPFNCNDSSFLVGMTYHMISPILNEDGSKLSYPEVGISGKYSGENIESPVLIHLVTDGKAGKNYEFIVGPKFLSNGEITYLAGGESGSRIITGDKEGKLYPEISKFEINNFGNLVFSALKITKENPKGKWYVVFNNKEIGPFDGLQDLVLSDSANRVGYAGVVNTKGGDGSVQRHYVAGDETGKTGPKLDFAGGVSFDGSGENISFWGRFGDKERVYVNFKGEAEYDQIISTPKWSKDGKFLGYGARVGKEIWWVVNEIKN